MKGNPVKKMVDIRPLKRTVKRDYPRDAPIRTVILGEPDEIPMDEYVVKLSVWYKLIPKGINTMK